MRQDRLAAKSPYCRLQSIGFDEVRWTEGFWAQRFDLSRSVIIPSMWEAMNDPENTAVFSNLYVAAGLREGTYRGTDWSDGDCYKWMEAASLVYGVTRDEALNNTLDELIGVIHKAQEPDGYICTQIQLTDRRRWESKAHHELYNMGHLMTSACVHHRVTGKDSFLNIAKKVADYLYTVFQPRPRELVHYCFNPSNIMGLVDLYRATGDARYLELAGVFVDMRGSAPEDFARKGDYVIRGGDQNQDRVPLRDETEAVGHAVTAMYLYCGASDVYAQTGEQALLEALDRIWNDVVSRKMYITGGVGALHAGASKRSDLVHEAFGLEYHLSNATAYNETCANIGNAMWNWRMLQITGEAKYADAMELVIYNSGLSPMSIDGTRFFYTNPLRWYGSEHLLLSCDAYARWRTFECYCCPPQVARTIARLHEWAYSLSDEGVWVHLYGGSRLQTRLADGSPLHLTQETDYPWNGQVKLTLGKEVPGEPFAVMLRIPAWADGAGIEINGAKADVKAKPSTYVALERRWYPGDVIQLTLPLDVRLMKAHPKVEEVRNQVAIMRGPVVYCLESVDLPEGVKVTEIHIPRHLQLAPRHDTALLGGVTVLEGEAWRISEGHGNDALYSEFGKETMGKVNITLIPYYAWNNRGIAEMTVWMPLCW